MKGLTVGFAIVVFVLGGTEPASASRSKHERVKLTTVKKGGKDVGVKLELMLRPLGASHQYVRIGIGPATGATDNRLAATDIKHGYLLFQKEIKLATPGQAETFTETLLFKDHPNIKPGAQVDVISAWHADNTSATGWHVWGKVGMSGQAETIPGAAAARKTTARKVRRIAKTRRNSKKSAGKKAAVKRAKQSATTATKKAAQRRPTSRRPSPAQKNKPKRSRARAVR